MNSLRYHANTFALIGQSAVVLPASIEVLDQVERRLGRPLPPSLREWYGLEGAVDLLRKYSNEDRPVPIEALGVDRDGTVAAELTDYNLLTFRVENQGVCVFSVRLDGADDPPVVVTYDNNFEKALPAATSFSEHVFTWTWDYHCVFHHDDLICAQNGPLTAATLAWLESQFSARQVTHGWPGHTQRRFEGDGQAILIAESDGQADWYLAAEDTSRLKELVQQVWNRDELHASLYAHTQAGADVLLAIKYKWK